MPNAAPRRRFLTFSVNLPPRLRAELQQIADAEAGYLGGVIRRACTELVDRRNQAVRRRERSDASA